MNKKKIRPETVSSETPVQSRTVDFSHAIINKSKFADRIIGAHRNRNAAFWGYLALFYRNEQNPDAIDTNTFGKRLPLSFRFVLNIAVYNGMLHWQKPIHYGLDPVVRDTGTGSGQKNPYEPVVLQNQIIYPAAKKAHLNNSLAERAPEKLLHPRFSYRFFTSESFFKLLKPYGDRHGSFRVLMDKAFRFISYDGLNQVVKKMITVTGRMTEGIDEQYGIAERGGIIQGIPGKRIYPGAAFQDGDTKPGYTGLYYRKQVTNTKSYTGANAGTYIDNEKPYPMSRDRTESPDVREINTSLRRKSMEAGVFGRYDWKWITDRIVNAEGGTGSKNESIPGAYYRTPDARAFTEKNHVKASTAGGRFSRFYRSRPAGFDFPANTYAEGNANTGTFSWRELNLPGIPIITVHSYHPFRMLTVKPYGYANAERNTIVYPTVNAYTERNINTYLTAKAYAERNINTYPTAKAYAERNINTYPTANAYMARNINAYPIAKAYTERKTNVYPTANAYTERDINTYPTAKAYTERNINTYPAANAYTERNINTYLTANAYAGRKTNTYLTTNAYTARKTNTYPAANTDTEIKETIYLNKNTGTGRHINGYLNKIDYTDRNASTYGSENTYADASIHPANAGAHAHNGLLPDAGAGESRQKYPPIFAIFGKYALLPGKHRNLTHIEPKGYEIVRNAKKNTAQQAEGGALFRSDFHIKIMRPVYILIKRLEKQFLLKAKGTGYDGGIIEQNAYGNHYGSPILLQNRMFQHFDRDLTLNRKQTNNNHIAYIRGDSKSWLLLKHSGSNVLKMAYNRIVKAVRLLINPSGNEGVSGVGAPDFQRTVMGRGSSFSHGKVIRMEELKNRENKGAPVPGFGAGAGPYDGKAEEHPALYERIRDTLTFFRNRIILPQDIHPRGTPVPNKGIRGRVHEMTVSPVRTEKDLILGHPVTQASQGRRMRNTDVNHRHGKVSGTVMGIRRAGMTANPVTGIHRAGKTSSAAIEMNHTIKSTETVIDIRRGRITTNHVTQTLRTGKISGSIIGLHPINKRTETGAGLRRAETAFKTAMGATLAGVISHKATALHHEEGIKADKARIAGAELQRAGKPMPVVLALNRRIPGQESGANVPEAGIAAQKAVGSNWAAPINYDRMPQMQFLKRPERFFPDKAIDIGRPPAAEEYETTVKTDFSIKNMQNKSAPAAAPAMPVITEESILSSSNINKLVDRVYRQFERKLRLEKQRRGI